MNEKQKLSKMSNLSYSKLEFGKHLRANMNLTRTEVNSMMNFRSRMTNLKCNYKSAYRTDHFFFVDYVLTKTQKKARVI